MAKLKVKRGKLPFKSLDVREKQALTEFERIVELGIAAIRFRIRNSTPSSSQQSLIGSSVKEEPMFKSAYQAFLIGRKDQAEIDRVRRKAYGAPDPEQMAMQGKSYTIPSHQEPLAALARILSIEEFLLSFEPPGNQEETEKKRHADKRDEEKTQYWSHAYNVLKAAGKSLDESQSILASDSRWQSLNQVHQIALESYSTAHKKWEKRRMAAYQARKVAEAYARQDGRRFHVNSLAEFWHQARAA